MQNRKQAANGFTVNINQQFDANKTNFIKFCSQKCPAVLGQYKKNQPLLFCDSHKAIRISLYV